MHSRNSTPPYIVPTAQQPKCHFHVVVGRQQLATTFRLVSFFKKRIQTYRVAGLDEEEEDDTERLCCYLY
jgi:hypothetical protein